MEMFFLVISMWGKTEMNEWLYIGNQYVLNYPMTQTECESMRSEGKWMDYLSNEYYRLQFDCSSESLLEAASLPIVKEETL